MITPRDDVARHTEPGDEQRRAARHDRGDIGDHALGHGREQVDTEGGGGELAHRRDLLDHLLRLHRRGAERSDPAGVADRRDQTGVGHPTHAREHHGVLDLEQVGQPRSQCHSFSSWSSHPATPEGG